jgi:hypothetical protein
MYYKMQGVIEPPMINMYIHGDDRLIISFWFCFVRPILCWLPTYYYLVSTQYLVMQSSPYYSTNVTRHAHRGPMAIAGSMDLNMTSISICLPASYNIMGCSATSLPPKHRAQCVPSL